MISPRDDQSFPVSFVQFSGIRSRHLADIRFAAKDGSSFSLPDGF
jgi:hypothetical protein